MWVNLVRNTNGKDYKRVLSYEMQQKSVFKLQPKPPFISVTIIRNRFSKLILINIALIWRDNYSPDLHLKAGYF